MLWAERRRHRAMFEGGNPPFGYDASEPPPQPDSDVLLL
jgi:hypothetical protein